MFYGAVCNVDGWLQLLLVLSLTPGKMINGMFEWLKVVKMNIEQASEVMVVFDSEVVTARMCVFWVVNQ